MDTDPGQLDLFPPVADELQAGETTLPPAPIAAPSDPQSEEKPKKGWADPAHPEHRPARAKWRDAWPGNDLAVKSGAQRAKLPAEELAAAVIHLFGDVSAWPLAARRTSEIAGQMWVRRQRALDWCAKVGMFRDDGSLQPVLRMVDTWDSKILALLREHGGTPMAMAQLTRVKAEARAIEEAAGQDWSAGRAIVERRRAELNPSAESASAREVLDAEEA